MRARLSLILPTLDERENVRTLVPELLSSVGDELHELLVVDDGSQDGTRELVAAFDDRRVRLIARDHDRGLTASLQAGVDAARGELIGWMDADGSMHASDVMRLLAAIDDGADLAVGSRYAVGGSIKGQTSPGLFGRLKALVARDLGSDGRLAIAASFALNAMILPLLLGGAAHDYTSGFLVARREIITKTRLIGDHGEYFITLWMAASRAGARIVEVPIELTPRRFGVSKTAPTLRVLVRRGVRYLSTALRMRSS